MVNKKQSKPQKQDDSKLFAFLAVLLSVIGFIIAYATKKENSYVMHYAKQSLVLFFGWIALWILSMILMMIPFIGVFVYWVAHVGLLVLWVIGLIYSLSGEMKDVPFVGDLARKFNF